MPDARVFRRCIVCRSHAADFGGSNVEASPYPAAVVIRGLAPSSVELTGKPFFVSGLSWLSYSRPSHFSTVPGLVSPVSPVARLKAPHAGQVERSAAADPNPLDGITQFENCLTHFDRWRPCTAKLHRVFPHRPHSGERLEAGDRKDRWERTPAESRFIHQT